MPIKEQIEKGKQILKEGYNKAKPTLDKVEDATMDIVGYIGETLSDWSRKHQKTKSEAEATPAETTSTDKSTMENKHNEERQSNKHTRS